MAWIHLWGGHAGAGAFSKVVILVLPSLSTDLREAAGSHRFGGISPPPGSRTGASAAEGVPVALFQATSRTGWGTADGGVACIDWGKRSE